jgi:very-short-patch-repair endonuclease
MAREANKIQQTSDGETGVAGSASLSAPDRARLVRVLGVGALLTVSGGRDQRIAAIAKLQRGRVSRKQLLAAGIDPSTVQRLLAKGSLHPIHAGVYAVGHSAPLPLGAETAALLACRDGAALSHATAAALWGLRAPADVAGPVQITVFGGESGGRPGIEIHRTTVLLPRDVRVHQRLPVTSPARTLLDVAGLWTARELEWAVDEGLIVRRIVRVSQLTDVLRRGSGRRGAALLAELLHRRTSSSVTRSEAEERFLALIRAAELPEPELNVRLNGFPVDFLWRDLRVAVEIDGYLFHTSRSAFDRDRRKDAVLKGAGWEVLRFSRDQVKFEPYAVLARVVQTLARAAAQHAA